MAKSTAVVQSVPPLEFQEIDVVVIRRKGNEKFDVLRGPARIDVSRLKIVEADCSMPVALGTRKQEQAKIDLNVILNPFGKGSK